MTDIIPDTAPEAISGTLPGTKKSFLLQVLHLAGTYWNCKRRAKVRSATLMLLLLTMGQVGLMVWVNYWNRALFDALEQHSVRGVFLQVGVFALIFVVTIAVTAAHLIFKRWLTIDCRAWLTELLIGSWMIGRPLVRATNSLQTAEATFRFGLSRARENTEAIALMRGETLERASSSARFGLIVREWDRQSLAYMGLVSFGSGYGALLPVFPILIAAPQYILGAMSLGVLMQAAQAFQRLTSALSWPVDNIGEIARCRASADRVLSLYEDLRQLDVDAQASIGRRIALERSERTRLVIEDLCIAEPSGHILLENFSADIRRGERVQIEGTSAVTGSLFKVIAGLWPWGSGRVFLPADGSMLFVAQRPFLPEGTLREALSYPHPPDAFPDTSIRHALECVGLAWLAQRMDERDDWEQVLPQRAQQRLGIARVLLQRPAWVFLQEATDSFDPKGERLILEMLRRELSNTTLLNISFHPGLRKLHHRTLILSRVHEAKVLLNGQRGNGGGSH